MTRREPSSRSLWQGSALDGAASGGRALVLVGTAVASGFFLLPVFGLLGRVEPNRVAAELLRPEVAKALGLSLVVSTGAVVIGLSLALPLAFALARGRFRGRRLLRALVALPMVLPPVVAGVGLLAALGRRGLFGPLLEALGVELAFSTAGALLAVTFVSAPFLVLTLEAGLLALDPRLEQAAATLGASPLRVLGTVTLPGLWPSIAAGASLAFARALGEFGATITFAGNYEGVTQTLPLLVYQTLQRSPEGAVLLSLLLLLVALLVLVVARFSFGASLRIGSRST